VRIVRVDLDHAVEATEGALRFSSADVREGLALQRVLSIRIDAEGAIVRGLGLVGLVPSAMGISLPDPEFRVLRTQREDPRISIRVIRLQGHGLHVRADGLGRLPEGRVGGSRTSRRLRALTKATAARASEPASRAETPACTRWFTRSSTRASRSKRPWKRAIPIIPSRRTRPQGGARRTSGRHDGWTSYRYRQGPSPLGQRVPSPRGTILSVATKYPGRDVGQTFVRRDGIM